MPFFRRFPSVGIARAEWRWSRRWKRKSQGTDRGCTNIDLRFYGHQEFETCREDSILNCYELLIGFVRKSSNLSPRSSRLILILSSLGPWGPWGLWTPLLCWPFLFPIFTLFFSPSLLFTGPRWRKIAVSSNLVLVHTTTRTCSSIWNQGSIIFVKNQVNSPESIHRRQPQNILPPLLSRVFLEPRPYSLVSLLAYILPQEQLSAQTGSRDQVPIHTSHREP